MRLLARSPSSRARTALTAGLLLSACDASAPAASGATTAAQEATVDPAIGPVALGYVSANGEGCPAGSWSASLSAGGRTLSLRFTGFDTTIDRQQTRAASVCNLIVALESAPGRSYRVENFVHRGYAYLERGIAADLTTTYFFQQDRAIAEQLRASLESPLDDAFALEASTRGGDAALWSPCGRTRVQALNLQLHVELRNGERPRDGTVELHDGVDVDLAWRTCDAPG